MNTQKVEWTKQVSARSVVSFILHFFLLSIIAIVLLMWDHMDNFVAAFTENGADYLYTAFCVLLMTIIMYAYLYFESRQTLANPKTISLLFVILDLYIILAFFIGRQSIYARPAALVALLVLVLVGRREAIFMNILAALFMFLIDNVSTEVMLTKDVYSALIISFTAGMIAIFFCGKVKTRIGVVKVGLWVMLPTLIFIALLELALVIEKNAGGAVDAFFWDAALTQMGYGVVGSLMSAVLFLAILPVFEWMFNCLTVYRLREITSHDAKLLKKLKEEAPGTFNHSVMVANLAEACATAIGEDADFARAAAYYHDVGKLHQPEYFTENQQEYNLHDELTPELSADIIRLHALDGSELIKSHRLPQFLADVAIQHHGTMPIRYFYAKALKMTDGELNIEDFSYAGPKPKTKIAAIIMIADGAEAAVRALPKRTPEAAEKVIRAVIEERMELEQFSDCDITMADLSLIRQTLVDTLTGVYHHRVKYPNLKYSRGEDGTQRGENE